MFIKKIHTISVFIISIFISIAVSYNVNASDIQPKAYWDRGDIMVQWKDESTGWIDGGCQLKTPIKNSSPNLSTYNDSTKKSIIECIKNSKHSSGLKSKADSLNNAKISITKYKAPKKDEYGGSYGTSPPTVNLSYIGDNNFKLECSPPDNKWSETEYNRLSCFYRADVDQSTEFKSRGIDKVGDNGEIIFATDDGSALYYNGFIQSVDFRTDGRLKAFEKGDGKVIGQPYYTWQENYFYEVMNKKYNSTRDEFVKNCDKNINEKADCARTKERAYGAFTQIWRTCVVATSVVDADIQNSTNCIEELTGVKIDTKEMLKGIPQDPGLVEDTDSCGIKTAGYIICPLMRFLAGAADKMFSLIKSLLMVSPIDVSQPDGQSAQKAWKVFLTIANIVFIILLFIVILSQVTSVGINNYGIKKILPRIIIGAILINASFYICVVAIDLSNILGDSIQKVMIIINNSITPAAGDIVLSADMSGTGNSTSSSWEEITDAILAAGIIAGAVIASGALVFTFLPVMTAVVLAAVTVVLTLIIRYGLILLLTVIAPIAFALYLLPNTKKWFNKWKSTFVSLLMLYPIISLIFGLSTLAANIVMQVASSNDAQMLAMFALAIQSIPFAITPIIVKSGGQLLGNIGSKIQNNRLFNQGRSLSKDSQSMINKRLKLAALEGKPVPFGSAIRFATKRKAVRDRRSGVLRSMESKYTSDYARGIAGSGGEKIGLVERAKSKITGEPAATKGEKFQEGMAALGDDGAKDRALAFVIASENKILTDEIKAKSLQLSGTSAQEAANTISQMPGSNENAEADPTKLALAEIIIKSDDSEKKRDLLKRTQNMSKSERIHVARAAARSDIFMRSPEAQAQVIAGNIGSDQDYYRNIVEPTVVHSSFTPGTIAGMSGDEKQTLVNSYSNLSSNAQSSLKGTITQTLGNDKVRRSLNESEIRQFTAIANS